MNNAIVRRHTDRIAELKRERLMLRAALAELLHTTSARNHYHKAKAAFALLTDDEIDQGADDWNADDDRRRSALAMITAGRPR